ncbi:unnamed protein product, partial [Mesorhabditis spiculigera]
MVSGLGLVFIGSIVGALGVLEPCVLVDDGVSVTVVVSELVSVIALSVVCSEWSEATVVPYVSLVMADVMVVLELTVELVVSEIRMEVGLGDAEYPPLDRVAELVESGC